MSIGSIIRRAMSMFGGARSRSRRRTGPVRSSRSGKAQIASKAANTIRRKL